MSGEGLWVAAGCYALGSIGTWASVVQAQLPNVAMPGLRRKAHIPCIAFACNNYLVPGYEVWL